MKRFINQIIILILIISLVIGLTAILSKKFSISAFQSFNVKFTNVYNEETLNNIVKEIFKDRKYDIEVMNVFDKDVRIKSTNISDEEKNQIITKINETFKTELKQDEIKIVNYPKKDIFNNYKLYVAYIATIIAIVSILCIIFSKVDKKN